MVRTLAAQVRDLQAKRDRLMALAERLVEERRPLWAEVRAWLARRLRGEGG